ncbi:hypothetical protein D5F52_26515 (plasmid) [Brevibacillus laterosporus]|uniref:hypothetical protein n=1 Tax=Brevibacillus laterosporus TaxID=1465 RepID=UPI000E6BFC7A|nr:hypothetical protein [Brevibacillus laterosporus]AYB41710.1 hypothetical protein D5F52_26515 [Brevibacillus laterosporus]
MGLKPTGDVKAEVWNRFTWVQLYDTSETVSLKKPTEKQLAAIEKANETRVRLRTCDRCGLVQKKKLDLKKGICKECSFQEWLCEQKKQAQKKLFHGGKTKNST